MKNILLFLLLILTQCGWDNASSGWNNYGFQYQNASLVSNPSAANVGIGSSAPSCKVDLSAGSQYCVAGIAVTGGGGGSGASFAASASQGTIGFLDVQGTLTKIGGNAGFIYTGAGSTVGNIGIGSLAPGQVLDVTGTVRATAFIGNGALLTGISSSQWTTTNTQDVYLPNNGNVGIGTAFTNNAALTVMNGNVGIGTWVPRGQLDVEGTLSTANFAGGITTPTVNTTIVIDGKVYAQNSTGIQKAENALPSTGGTIYCPHGTYSFTSTVNITVPTTFIGEGIGGPTGYFGGSWNNVTQTLFTLANSVNAPMFNIETTGGGTQHGAGGGMYHIGIYGNYENNTSPTGDLIKFINWSDYMMWDLVILHATDNTTYYAISADANSWNIEFDEVQIEDSLGGGMKLLGHRFWLKGEHFRNVTGDAVYNTYNGSSSNENGLSIDGLDCYDNGQRCINLYGGSYANISNVWLNSNSQSSSNTYDGIYIQNSTNSVTLSNINFQDTSIRYGINVSDSGSSNINGTTINFMSAPVTGKTNVNASATGINLEYGVPNGVNFSAGNVGIGSTNPMHHMDITDGNSVSGLQLTNTNSSNYAAIRVQNSASTGFILAATGSGYAVPNVYGLGVDTGNPITFFNSSGTKFMTIDTNGNVGIGTVNPKHTLEIVGSVATSTSGTPTAGVTKTCTTYPTVINGIVTSC